jgi:hypothetical protein
VIAVLCAAGAGARTHVPATLADLASSAATVFRGRCVAAEVETADVAGARVPVTVYTFDVADPLKGAPGRTITFRQVGAPEGGPRDLASHVGLPAYTPGLEYVLFLLPESGAGLTSPAGAGEGAFLVVGEEVHGVPAGPVPPAATTRAAGAPAGRPEASRPPETMSYEALRRAVLDHVGR